MIGAEDVGWSFRPEKTSYYPPKWYVCCKAFSKVSGKCQVAPEVNEIWLLASAISPADTIPR